MTEQLQRVNLYLDVDGVINAVSLGIPRTNTNWRGEWRREKVGAFPILWAPELIEALNTITTRPELDGRWLTTWEERAPEFLAPAVGLHCEGWPVLTGAINDSPMDWWKLAQIQADIAKTRPAAAVWIDDDIPFDPKTAEWLASVTGTRILTIAPNPNHGLTRRHIQTITDFLNEMEESAA